MTASTRLTLPADGLLSLVTLGDAVLYLSSSGAEPERVLELSKPLALLIYLACSPDRDAPRDHLTDLLWAHMERDRAQNALRQTIWQLRSRFGDDILTATRDRVTLTDSIEIDRDAFLAASAAGDVDRIIDLYRGDFVTGFAAPGGTDFEHWADLQRLALRRVFIRSAEGVVQQRLAAGHARSALALARRARDLDRLNQRAWRQVLECLIAAGDSVGAHIEADALAHLLEAEEVEAEPATRATMRDARATPNGSPTSKPADSGTALVAELIGREREFAAIMQAWESAGPSQAKHFHIVAPAGLGKTRFLVDVQNRLRSAGARAVYIRADFGARDIAYAFASDLAARLARLRGASGVSSQSAGALVALNPSLSSLFSAERDVAVDDEALRRRALAIRELITTIAEENPVALLIDDLHWADAHSFRALDTALGGIEKSRLLVVSTGRPTADDGRRPARATPITLSPLGAEAIAALVSSLGDLPPEPWAERLPHALWKATDGSPLLVLETLQLLIEQSLLVRSSDRWIVDDADAVFRALEQGSALRRRVASLGPLEGLHLLLLSAAGMPLDREVLADAVNRSSEESAPAIAILEQRGLVLPRGDLLAVAHDEHATAAVEGASPDAVERAAGAVGGALLSRAGSDTQKLCIAGSMLARAGDAHSPMLSTAFVRFVRAMRLAGDRRSDRVLARELLAASATESLETFLVRSLSLLMRARLVSRGRIAATIAIGGIFLFTTAIAWATMSRPGPPPDAVLVAQRKSVDRATVELFPVPLDASRWVGISALDVSLSGRPKWRLDIRTAGRNLRPDGRGWTAGVPVPDSGVLDIFDFGLDGSAKRLTFARLDDYQPSWAPDNSRFVFITSQWSHSGHYDLAIYDTLTRQTRQLTQGDDTDWGPAWSPDGSRIAFIRQYSQGGLRGLCVLDADGDNLRCLPPKPTAEFELVTWADAHRVVVRQAIGNAPQLARFDIDTDSTDLVADRDAVGAAVSPDGRFAVCQCPRQGYSEDTWIVYPIDRPNEFTVLRTTGGDARDVAFEWSPTSRRLPFLAHLNIMLGLGPPVLGASYRLRALGTDTAGQTVAPGVVRWRSEDTLVATIDSAGSLTPRRAGRVTISASAGGWREARTTITIAEPNVRVLLDNDWSRGFGPTWRLFGIPKPFVDSNTTLGTAFVNNGDGSFFSGAYTTKAFETRDGLWLEAELSAPINASESQDLDISLSAMMDSTAWANWDHATGDGPARIATPRMEFRYPVGIGGAHFGEQFLVANVGSAILNAPPSIRTGRPFRLVLQIFPDGHCAAALDGRLVWTGPASFFQPTVHVMLAGNTVKTKILVGHLRVVTGIAPNIAWDARR